MSIHQESCFTINCDDCGRYFGDSDEEMVLHFTTRCAATDAVLQSQWLITGDRTICSTCTRLASCRLLGHDWNPWIPDCYGPLPFRRDCNVCWEVETTNQVDQATQEQEPGSEPS